MIPIPTYRQQEVQLLKEMYTAGRYRAVIDRRYPLAEIADAYRYVQTGEKAGVVVIDIVREVGLPCPG